MRGRLNFQTGLSACNASLAILHLKLHNYGLALFLGFVSLMGVLNMIYLSRRIQSIEKDNNKKKT